MSIKGVARLGDVTTHKGILAAPVNTSVLTNDRPTAHIGTVVFCPAGTPPHGAGVVVGGNSSVKVGGIPIAHRLSPTTCGALVATASGDVNA
jgi:uncharacterized Zn-binding protein involved in type VI secretion